MHDIVGTAFLFGGIVLGAGSIYSIIFPIPGESPFVIAAGFLFAAGLIVASKMISTMNKESNNYPEPFARIDAMRRITKTPSIDIPTPEPGISEIKAIISRQLSDYADIDEL